MYYFIFAFVLISNCLGKPTLVKIGIEPPATLEDGLKNVAKSSMQVVQSTSDVVDYLRRISTDAASNVASSASRIAVDYANGFTDVNLNLDLDFKGIDLEAAVNQTEDSKIAMIKSIFDAKRQFIKALESTILNASVVNLDAAFEAAQNGVTVSKTTISDLAERLTVENAQKAIEDAQEAINDAIKNSRDVIESNRKILIETLTTAQKQIHEAAVNFNSEQAFQNGQKNLAEAVNISIQGAESLAKNLGVFKSLDNIVRSIAVPISEYANSDE